MVLFLPFDSCYLSILEKSDDILDLCFEKNIMLAGPISIMSLISTITSIKNQEKQISQIDTIIGKAEDIFNKYNTCLLYTSDAADERSSVDLGGRRIIKTLATIIVPRVTPICMKAPLGLSI